MINQNPFRYFKTSPEIIRLVHPSVIYDSDVNDLFLSL
jgi:hypothetical protein